jgi:hypothetical protein
MRILMCDDMFPSMIDTIRNLLREDDVRVCRQTEVARQAPSFTALGRPVADNVERLRRGEAVRNAVGP